MDTHIKAVHDTIALGPTDLFAVLDQAYRRHKKCLACSFSLPELVMPGSSAGSNWTVIPSTSCCDNCRDVLDQLVSRFQSTYRLKDA